MTTKKINLVCESRLDKYFSITESAFKLAKENVNKEKQHDAEKILQMAECYIKDAKHFQKQGHYVNAFAAINYAHGWLDTGARLKIFNVTDGKLFTIA